MTPSWDEHERRDRILHEFAARTRHVARTDELDRAAVEAIRALRAEGIDALLLKGAALSRTLYRGDERRGYYDVDLLVSLPDLKLAGGVLSRLGYSNLNQLKGLVDVAEILHAEVWSRWVTDVGNVAIDLHWKLDGCAAPPERIWSVLGARRATLELPSGPVATLDKSALAMHLTLHAAQHGPDDVRAIADLARGLERWPDAVWVDAAGLADTLGAREAFAAGLSLTAEGAAVADALGLPASTAADRPTDDRAARPRGTFHLQALSDAASLRRRIAIVRAAVLPPRAWIVWEARSAPRGRLGLLRAYAAHLIRLPGWAARAWRYRRVRSGAKRRI